MIADPSDSNSVYIFAVNHAPNTEYYSKVKQGVQPGPEVPKAASRIELFHHTLGTQRLRHLRTVQDPLIATPNDVYAESPTSFFVSNDHRHREGLWRLFEATFNAEWSDIVHVQLDDDSKVHAKVALDGISYPNGLGHGRKTDDGKDEIMFVKTTSATLSFLHADPTNHTIRVEETVEVPTQIDQPYYYSDPLATGPDDDASGYVVAGLARAFDVFLNSRNPHGKEGAMVWYLQRTSDGWKQPRLLFEDDGTNIRGASSAVLVPIVSSDGKKKKDDKEAWLFVSGFFSEAIVAVRVKL